MVDDKGLCSISFDHGKDAIDSSTNAFCCLYHMVDDKGLCSISFDHGKDAIDSSTNAVKNIFLLSLSLSLSQ